MSKTDTWMPLYIGDYLADTMRLSTIEHGAYLLLLMEYWRQGPLPDDDAELADTCKMSVKEWGRISKRIRSYFTAVDGLLHQKRIDAERLKAEEISNKRRAAVAQRADRQPTKKDTSGPQGGNNGSTNVDHEFEGEATNVARLKTHARLRQSQSPSQEDKEEPPSLRETPPPRKVGLRLPSDWCPSETECAFAASLGLDPDRVAAKFRDFWHAKPGQGGVKLDWTATWRNWCREDAERRRPTSEDPMAKLSRVMGLKEPNLNTIQPEQGFIAYDA